MHQFNGKIFTETLKCLYWLSEFVIYWQMKWRTCWPRPASVTTWYRLSRSTRASWTPRVSSSSRWPPTCSSFYSLEVGSQRLTVDKEEIKDGLDGPCPCGVKCTLRMLNFKVDRKTKSHVRFMTWAIAI